MDESVQIANKAFRVILLAVEDVVGKQGAETILQSAGRGRATNAIQEHASLANAAKLAAKGLPRRMKVKLTLRDKGGTARRFRIALPE